MDMTIKEQFLVLWGKYFNDAELPIVFYYTDDVEGGDVVPGAAEHRCLFADLIKVRKGEVRCFGAESVGCFGGKRYLGFSQEIRPGFEYFLSCGIPGTVEGERYKKTPELVQQFLANAGQYDAPGEFIVFKRWDQLEEQDEPDGVVFFAGPDVLSGLFTLANFDEASLNGVIAPFGPGCGAVVQYCYQEKTAERPRAVLGMFDVSARPYVGGQVLSFSVPIRKFVGMVGNMEESFLIMGSWSKVQKRI